MVIKGMQHWGTARRPSSAGIMVNKAGKTDHVGQDRTCYESWTLLIKMGNWDILKEKVQYPSDMLLLLSHFSHVRLCGPHRRQPTRLPCPWDSSGKNTGMGCHFLLQCMKVKMKSLSRVRPSATPWTAAFQAPASMDFPGKSTGVGCHCLLLAWWDGYLEWDISLPSFKISYLYSKIFLELCEAICVHLDRWQ